MAEDLGRVDWIRSDGFKTTRKKIRCGCGEEIVCSGFTNACDCGADYNMSGTLLADRSQWGAETGESVSDILAADGPDPFDEGPAQFETTGTPALDNEMADWSLDAHIAALASEKV